MSEEKRWTIRHVPRSPLGAYIKGPATDEVEVVPASEVERLREREREAHRAHVLVSAELKQVMECVDDALSALGTGYVPDEWSEDFAKALHAEADGARVALRQVRLAFHPTEKQEPEYAPGAAGIFPRRRREGSEVRKHPANWDE